MGFLPSEHVCLNLFPMSILDCYGYESPAYPLYITIIVPMIDNVAISQKMIHLKIPELLII